MVCKNCRKGGMALTAGETAKAKKHHRKCPGGTWCDCQCDTTPGMINRSANNTGVLGGAKPEAGSEEEVISIPG